MAFRSWLGQVLLQMAWPRLTPAQRALFLFEHRYDLWHALTPVQQLALGKLAATPAHRDSCAHALADLHRVAPYVY